jgi:hypothetical protein
MHRYVDDASLNVNVRDLANEGGDAPRDLYTARRNSREDNVLKFATANPSCGGPGISLSDLVRDPSKRATNCIRVHDGDGGWWILFCLVHAFPWRPHRITLKEKN